MDLGECFRFIGYPASTGILYFILYSGIVVFILVWCMLIFCGHVYYIEMMYCVGVKNTYNNVDDTCFVHVLILTLVQILFPSLQAQPFGLIALQFYATTSGLTHFMILL